MLQLKKSKLPNHAIILWSTNKDQLIYDTQTNPITFDNSYKKFSL